MNWPRYRPRLLPLAMAAIAALAVVKAESLWRAATTAPGHPGGALAADPPAPAPAPRAAEQPRQRPVPAELPPPPPDPAIAAERALLETLRGRRTELDAREQALAAREQVLAAAERRLTARIDEMTALQDRLMALERGRAEREEAGWRGLVKLYEGMRPRDAAQIFDDLEMSVLVQLVDRMREAKAAPVIGTMRPERARELTAELARLRAARAGG
jgi:flagellar motility protein MotE (MotC chaperone)